jgi:two-component system phosphate regulon sensor histidine kinase PhoR
VPRWAVLLAALLASAAALSIHQLAGARFVVLEVAAAGLTGAAVAVMVAQRRAAVLREMADAAHRVAEGDLAARAPARGSDALAQVGAALNRIAANHAARLRELSGDRDLATAILDGMGEGVLVLDRRGRIVLANRAARTMTLLGPEAIGKTVLETLRNATLQELIDKAERSEEPVEREVALGGLFPRRLRVRVSRMRGPAAEPGIIAVFHDVTDLRRLETIRTDFVANVSHELRTPVTAISTSVETLLAGALTEPVASREFVEVIERQARRLRQLVDDLLDLSRMESKGFKLNLAEAELLPVVEQSVRLLVEPARQRRVQLRVIAPAGPVRARVDRRAFEQVMMNLLDNAIKYAGDGAEVGVELARDGAQATLRVTDNGPGIAPAHLGRIFERFYRVEPGRSRELGGTGLGLSIVKHLVELMHGTIEVTSNLGQGTVFCVRLPSPPPS